MMKGLRASIVKAVRSAAPCFGVGFLLDDLIPTCTLRSDANVYFTLSYNSICLQERLQDTDMEPTSRCTYP